MTRTFINIIFFSLLFFVCLIVDVRTGLHVFTMGFLISSLFFLTTHQIFLLLLLFAFFHDVRFQFPLGLTFLIIFPFVLVYPVLLKFLHSRMLVLYCYLTLAAIACGIFQYWQDIEPQHVLWTAVLAGGWVVAVYAYSIGRYQKYSFNFRKKLRF